MELLEILRGRGYRVTDARRAVWQALGEIGEHATAQQIAERVATIDAAVNVSSVYRTLELFAELDLVRESRTDVDGSITWELGHSDEHIHLVCGECLAVLHHSTANVSRIRRELAERFDVDVIDVRVTGRCRPSCK